MRLVLTIDGSVIEFTPLNDSGPYPYLKGTTPIREGARAGASASFGSTETPSTTVSLKNDGGRVAEIIGNPMRARAELYDGDFRAFSGFVQSIEFGLAITLRLES